MATPAGASGAREVSVPISDPAAKDASGGKLQKREKRLNRFVRFTASGEWAGNAFGALAFLWATGVLLGGFCPCLKPRDFWYATVIIFIEAFRIFSRNYKMDNQSLFGTTRALKWVNVSFARILGRPQEGNEVVLIMGLWINLVNWLPVIGPMFMGILQAALLILMSKMQLQGDSQLTKRSRRHRRLQLGAVLITFLIIYVLFLSGALDDVEYPMLLPQEEEEDYDYYSPHRFLLASVSTEILMQVVAVLLLIFRPLVAAKLTVLSTPWSRRVLSLAKVISSLSLAFGLAVALRPLLVTVDSDAVDPSSFITAFTVAVLSLGSLQTPAANLSGGRFIDVILHVLFLWYLLILVPAFLFRGLRGARLLTSLAAGLSAAVLLMENLQIPTAALQVLLSSSRFHGLKSDYQHPLPDCPKSPNMVPAIRVFYVLALCQGSLYIAASIVGLVSFFPRRSLVRHSRLSGQRGAKAIDIYYEYSYSTCMETGLFGAGRTMSLASFAMESLRSSSSDIRLAGILVLANLLQERLETDSSKELRSRIISSDNRTLLSTLVGMLGWADVQHKEIRLMVARVIDNLADSISISEIPSTLRSVSSLLDADNQPAKKESGRQDSLPEAASVNRQRNQETSEHTVPGSNNNGGNAAGNQRTGVQLAHGRRDDNGWCHRWVRGCWHRLKEKCSILEEMPLTHQDSLPILGIKILEKLARDPDNCAEIVKATYLISKIIGLISYTTDSGNCNDEQQQAVISSSLNFVRRLAMTRENIGATIRQDLCKNPFLLTNLECILEDSRSSLELMELVIEILTKLAFDEDARKEIGRSKVTVCKLMHAFIGKDGSTNNVCYDQSLRMVAGEALANLTVDSPENCLAILEEMGYELIKDLKDMLCKVEYRYVATSMLQNLCAHSMDKLSHHQGVGRHLSSALPMLMESMMSTRGKQLETLIGLISQISDVIPEAFVRELQLQTYGSGLVHKLVGTLNSNRKPDPEYPRMRRVVVEIMISIVKLCPRYATIFREAGMVQALNRVERTPSKVEKYRVFYGNVGVVLESGSSLAALASMAEGLVQSGAPALGA